MFVSVSPEARGQRSHGLLHTVFPQPLDEIEADLRAQGGAEGAGPALRSAGEAPSGRAAADQAPWWLGRRAARRGFG